MVVGLASEGGARGERALSVPGDICGACPRQAWDFAPEYPIFNLQSTVFRRSEPITKGLVP